MKTVGQHNQADINLFMGATGSGKSLTIKAELKRDKPQRLMVWDFKHEYDLAPPITSIEQARQMAYANQFKIVFRPTRDPARARKDFDLFCRIAFEAKRLTFVGEELAFVTTASWSPQGWNMLTLAGRSEALTVYGTSQRPAMIDKNIFSNFTRVRTGRLNFEDDVRTMAKALKVKPEQIDTLLPLQYIERNINTQQITTGTIPIPRTRR